MGYGSSLRELGSIDHEENEPAVGTSCHQPSGLFQG
jgi:hypothetical protein